MKKNLLFLIIASFFTVAVIAQNSPYITKVHVYAPAPGQFVNLRPVYAAGDDVASMSMKAEKILTGSATSEVVSLGGFGGYIVIGFDHTIVNVAGKKDFKVLGNASYASDKPDSEGRLYGSCEPGIVMVSYDTNKNGLPDDEWYELAGSEYYKETTIKNYEITYTRPEPVNDDCAWTDNQGKSGSIKRNQYNTQDSYYPLWISSRALTLKGNKLKDNTIDLSGNGSNWTSYAYDWGYADNHINTSDLSNFDIDWAVDSSGKKVYLEGIDFIKIYTAVNQDAGWIGEVSTEIAGVEDLHPEATSTVNPDYTVGGPIQFPEQFTGEYDIINLDGILTKPNSYFIPEETEDSKKGQYGGFYTDMINEPFKFEMFYDPQYNYWTGFTYSNVIDTVTPGYTNQFAAATGGGTQGSGSTYMIIGGDTEMNFTDETLHSVTGVYVTNSTYTYLSMRDGDSYAKKFGGESGNEQDWFLLTAIGYDADGKETGKTEIYLADLRSDDNSQDYIANNWRWFDLSVLGKVASINFSLSSSDNGEYGMNTPNYFCLDRLMAEKAPTGIVHTEENKFRAYPTVTQGNVRISMEKPEKIQIFDLFGRNIQTIVPDNNEIDIDLRAYPSNIYVIKIGNSTQKVIKR